MADDDEPPLDDPPPEEYDNNVLVFRNGANQPVAVPADVVTAAERTYRCYQAKVGGKSWAEIAEQENYPSASAAKADVARYMGEAQSLIVEASMRSMLTLEVARLDALQASFWGQAMMGHVPSGRMVLDVIRTRAAMVGLDPEKMGEAAQGARTVVVKTDSEEGYVASLQQQSDPLPGADST